MKVLYFHGGPGFNSNPEKQMLVEPFRARGFDLLLWNEPQPRTDEERAKAFARDLESAEAFFREQAGAERVVLMGHSFGAQPVRYLAKQHPEQVALAAFVDPAFALPVADRNIMGLALADFVAQKAPQADELRQCIGRLGDRFDAQSDRGFRLVLEDASLFAHYWVDHAIMSTFLGYYAGEWALDFEAFFAVRHSWFDVDLADSPVPAAAVFGARDVVVSKEAESAILGRMFRNLTIHDIPDSAHYPHVERTDRVLEVLSKALGA